MRGEKCVDVVVISANKGSPPLARGKVSQRPEPAPITGITPACAGKSSPSSFPASRSKDHPRLRGEKFYLFNPDYLIKGSPPLARGKVFWLFVCGQCLRITPACAGKSLTQGLQEGMEKDHPRLRGEKKADKQMSAGKKGSPPLARGKVKQFWMRCPPSRITPACAGKSGLTFVFLIGVGDHPRLRGEKFFMSS